jgi:hypothetical protein
MPETAHQELFPTALTTPVSIFTTTLTGFSAFTGAKRDETIVSNERLVNSTYTFIFYDHQLMVIAFPHMLSYKF